MADRHPDPSAADGNPLSIVAGGLAIGALAGALLPRSERERELAAPVGAQLAERARAAIQAARDTGEEQLARRGLTKDAAKSQLKYVLDGFAKAASEAGSAAAKKAASGN